MASRIKSGAEIFSRSHSSAVERQLFEEPAPMVSHARGRQSELCPHIEQNDVRCNHRFCLTRLDQAFSVCLGAFHGCPMYHRLNRESDAPLRLAHDGEASIPLIDVTTHGRTIALRPTGS
jgi:hypothetical protein